MIAEYVIPGQIFYMLSGVGKKKEFASKLFLMALLSK
jgi:hypothetical protein